MKFISNSIHIWAARLVIGVGVSCGLAYATDSQLEVVAVFNGANGAIPGSLLQKSDGSIYGTTEAGGPDDLGTMFVIEPHQALKTLVTFTGSNGSRPGSRLFLGRDGYLYGTTREGGANGLGTVFRMSPDQKFEILVSFDQRNGSGPQTDLVLGKDGSIYGCTENGGTENAGTFFQLDRNKNLKTLVNFSGAMGQYPQGISQGENGRFYGTTREGGDSNLGTIFTVGYSGDFKRIYSFTAAEADMDHSHLVQSAEGGFYGTSYNGGNQNLGVIYAISPAGVFTRMSSFNGTDGAHPGPDLVEWNDGYFYMTSLIENTRIKSAMPQWAGVNFCGTTSGGGEFGSGTVFRLTTDGSIQTLVSFTGTNGRHPGTAPNSLMPAADGNLYGTTISGGPADMGTIFRLQLPNWNEVAITKHEWPNGGLPAPHLLPLVSP